MARTLDAMLSSAGAPGVELPDPLYKTQLRSICCEAGVKQAKDLERVEVVFANYSQIKMVWNGWWICNDCGRRTMTYKQTVLNKRRPVNRYQMLCLDQAYGTSNPNQTHEPDHRTRKCSCGSDITVTSLIPKSEAWFAHLRRSKHDTFHTCISQEIAKDLRCPMAGNCKYSTASMKSWALTKEKQEGMTKHYRLCPAVINAPKPPKKEHVSSRVDVVRMREEGQREVERLFEGLFDNISKELDI